MGAEVKKIAQEIHGSVIRAPVAMILSYDVRFAFQTQENNPHFSYLVHFQRFYRSLHQRHISVDIVAPNADLSKYKLVIAPTLYLLSEAEAENLRHYAREGGALVLTFRSGVKDEFNAVVNRPLPGLLAELCGLEVEEYDSLPEDVHNQLEFTLPEMAPAAPVPVGVWCDVLRTTGATVVARYTRDYYAGKPAITLNRYGRGAVVYVGTMGDARLYETLADWLFSLAGVRPILNAPQEVEVTERWQGDRRLLFLLNHTAQEREVALDGRYLNLLGDSTPLEGRVVVAPRDVLVLVEEGSV